jgi:transposase
VPKRLAPRPLSEEEERSLERLARSRTEPARAVERARIVWLAHQGESVAAIAEALAISPATVRMWLHRFNRQGVAGLADRPRAGRPPAYTPEQVGEVIAASLTDPRELGLPFAAWTLDRLSTYLNEERGIPIKRSRIGEVLQAEGLRWRTQETWFGERPDPAFAAKRGRSSRSIPLRRRGVSPSASTKWARRAPRASRASG